MIEVPPGVRHREAWSKRSDKYYYIVSGRLSFTLDGVAHALAAGTFRHVAQGRRFSYRNDGNEPARLVLVHVPSFELASAVFTEAT